MKHLYFKCNCHKSGCMWCDGGLALCIACKGFEGTLTTDCPGVKLTKEQELEIYNTGTLDFIDGQWVRKPTPHSGHPDQHEFSNLRDANIARQREWTQNTILSLTYRTNELAGEVGEACNIAKKIERERLGMRGNRDTVKHLAEELADVIICADLVAMHEGIDLMKAVAEKFNKTSEENGLKTKLTTLGE